MNPPSEQLIRDYLKRLSLAARGQLGPDDRRALVERTRELIESRTSAGGPPTTVEVGRLLSGLGDPGGLVSQERQRLAALRGETVEPVSRSRLARALRGDPGKARGASWHWPVQPGSRTDLQLMLIGAEETAEPHLSAAGAADSGFALPEAESEPAGQQAPGAPAAALPAAALPTAALPVAELADDRAVTWELALPAALPVPRVRQVLVRAVAWSRKHKLEATAVVLLGLGGAIFPPVWLLGVVIALTSRLWDSRDKWVGLGLPVALTVIATAVALILGSRASLGHQVSIGRGMHDGWVCAVDASRATAVLSACYLARRAARGPRPPAVPPWSKPRRVT